MKVYQAVYPVMKPYIDSKVELIEAENFKEAKRKVKESEPHLSHISNIELYTIIPSNEFDNYFRTKDEFGQTVYYRKDELK